MIEPARSASRRWGIGAMWGGGRRAGPSFPCGRVDLRPGRDRSGCNLVSLLFRPCCAPCHLSSFSRHPHDVFVWGKRRMGRCVTIVVGIFALAGLTATAQGQKKKASAEFTRQGLLIVNFAPGAGADLKLGRHAADVVRDRIGRFLRADEFLLAHVAATPAGVRLWGDLILLRDDQLRQAIAPATAPKLDS